MDNGRRIHRVAAWLRELDVKVDVELFASRIKIQKFTYLLGVLLNDRLYDFGWFTKGPYSKELTEDYYAGKELFGKGAGKLNDNEKKEIARLKNEKMNSLDPDTLEIMASLYFIMHDETREKDEETAIKELMERKPYLELRDIVRGLNALKEFMLKENDRKKLLSVLEKETEPFERASLSDMNAFSGTSREE